VYDDNIYYSPEKFGFATVGEIDWSSGYYEFNITLVLRRISDGQLFYANDRGCSCPSPFETHKLEDLVPCTSQEFQAHLESCLPGEQTYDADYGNRPAKVADIMFRVTTPIGIAADSSVDDLPERDGD
jgi:hypothetical protein